MIKKNRIFFMLIGAFLMVAIWSCTKNTESEDQELIQTEELSENLKSLYESEGGEVLESFEQEEDVVDLEPRAKEYCVGKVTKVYFVKKGDEDKYKVGAIICNECDPGQTTCKASYITRIWRNGVHVATIKVENDPLNCTDCPRGGIKIH